MRHRRAPAAPSVSDDASVAVAPAIPPSACLSFPPERVAFQHLVYAELFEDIQNLRPMVRAVGYQMGNQAACGPFLVTVGADTQVVGTALTVDPGGELGEVLADESQTDQHSADRFVVSPYIDDRPLQHQIDMVFHAGDQVLERLG